MMMPTDSASFPGSPTTARLWFHNNVAYNVDGWTRSVSGSAGSPSKGWILRGGYGSEDLIAERNTIFDNRGADDAFVSMVQNRAEGMTLRDNIFFVQNSTRLGIHIENVNNCSGTGTTALNCLFPVNFIWDNNVLIPGWTNSQTATTAITASNVTTAYSGLTNTFIRTEATVPDRIAALKWFDTVNKDFRLRHDSPYVLIGRGGKPIGADLDALDDKQGVVKNSRVLNIGTTTATVAFNSVDICTVGVYTTDPTTLVIPRVTPTVVGGRLQSASLTGLSSGTVYNARIDCPTYQPVVSFRTR